MVALTFFLSYR